jgi:hypothetical protein
LFHFRFFFLIKSKDDANDDSTETKLSKEDGVLPGTKRKTFPLLPFQGAHKGGRVVAGWEM